MTYTVRTNVPLPKTVHRGRASVYPLSDLEVGDSFVVTDKSVRTVRSAVAAFQKKYKAKFAVRTLDTGVGVWRTD